MKVYTRLTPRDWHEAKVKYSTPQAQQIVLKKCWNLENAIESGELYDREEARKETARDILKPLYDVIMEHSYYCVNLSEDIKFLMGNYGIWH